MAKPNIQDILITQTFQNWLQKTNEVVEVIRTDAVTAGGDTTDGDVILTGDITAENVIAGTLLQADNIGPQTGGQPVTINAQTRINGTSQEALIVSNGTGGQITFTNGSLGWAAGLKDNSGDFIIDTGAGADKFNLATNGMLTVPNLTAIEDVTAVNFIGDGSQLTGVVSSVALDDVTDVTLTNVSNGQVLKYSSSQNAWVNDTDFVGEGGGGDADTLGGLAATSFLRSNADDTYTGTLTVTGDIDQTGDHDMTGTLTVTGEILATGDVITAYSASDERLKENLKVIEQPLDKISEISGYTFNYKNKPDETVPGVVAQEVEKILPNVVFDHEREGGTYKAVRYDQIIPLLIEGIKELKEKVNDLEDQLKS
jgi:hypothetical protein